VNLKKKQLLKKILSIPYLTRMTGTLHKVHLRKLAEKVLENEGFPK